MDNARQGPERKEGSWMSAQPNTLAKTMYFGRGHCSSLKPESSIHLLPCLLHGIVAFIFIFISPIEGRPSYHRLR
jgi:hypothetical protein